MQHNLIQNRIYSIDLLRGIIMVIMALDHTRDFFLAEALIADPTAVDKTSPLLFFTRWITHLCAPGFVFLAGTSAFISGANKTKHELSRFLLTRGLWLIVLEIVVLRAFFFFNFYYDVTFLTVLWVIGWCMIFLAGLIYLPWKCNLVIGFCIVFFHDAVGLIAVEPNQLFYAPWIVLMRTGFLPITPEHAFVISYPIIPWLGIMLLGFSAGTLFTDCDAATRKRWLIRSGMVAIVLFMVFRFINFYGDPAPWQTQPNSFFTFLSFINTTKYPVSLHFTLMTIGPLLLILGALDNVNIGRLAFFNTYGKVPLFYFLLHFFVIHIVALTAFIIKTGTSLSEIDFHFAKSFGGITPGIGHSLGGTYVAWICIVLILYPACKWYGRYKQIHAYGWLRYL